MSSVAVSSRAALFAGVVAAGAWATPALAQTASLIARWEFDGTYANSAPPNPNFPGDYSLTPGGGVTLVPSPRGMAAEFHGGTYPIDPPGSMSNPLLDRLDTAVSVTSASFNGGFSVMGWVLAESDPHQFLLLGHSIEADQGIGCNYTPATEGLNMALHSMADERLVATQTTGPRPIATWTHVAMTWNGSHTGGFALYVNGTQVPHSITTLGTFPGLNGTQFYPIRIGAIQGAYGEVWASRGAIDHLSLWSGVLTPQQVLDDYGCTTLSVQVSPAAVCPGGTVTLSVTEPNATAFQWQVEVPALPGTWVNLFDHPGTSCIIGSGTPTLTICNITRSAAAQYRCVVTTTSCAGGTLTSNPATVFVGGPQCGCVADVDDGSGTGTLDGGVTIDDLLYFLQRFEAGC